jgi:predicted ester cyclase
MSPDQVKQLLYRLNDELMNEGKLDVADELFTPDHLHRNSEGDVSQTGPAGVKQATAALRAGFPDLHITVDALIVEGDEAAARWTCVGTYQGEPDEGWIQGQKVTWSGISFFRLRDGRICERWVYGSDPKPVS